MCRHASLLMGCRVYLSASRCSLVNKITPERLRWKGVGLARRVVVTYRHTPGYAPPPPPASLRTLGAGDSEMILGSARRAQQHIMYVIPATCTHRPGPGFKVELETRFAAQAHLEIDSVKGNIHPGRDRLHF